ncbi:MAG: hypothetical protein COA97_00305 [Flavobacteriales bacterium]|nr:MAG: hypothetical protein COA97_00305 [Flavobacteriales bacterium]
MKQEMKCPKCGTKLDWWKLLLRHFEWGIPSYLYSIVGGLRTTVMIHIKPNETFELDLVKLGIPEESKILHVGYTPNDKGLFPLEIHGNTPYRHFIPHKILLFGRPIGEPCEKTPVAVSIDWVKNPVNNEIWNNLIESVEAFSINRFQSSVIPANVAVEAKLNEIIDGYLSRYASVKRVADFLTSGATYSHQLNILLPLIASFEDFPILPNDIRGSLNELRVYRNEIAHKGMTTKPLEKSTMSTLLCSASFAMGYLKLLEEKINKNHL